MTYSDDDVDHDLLDFMRQAMSKDLVIPKALPTTKVLEHAQYVVDNAIDVSLVRDATISAASKIYSSMQERAYSTATWSSHELHPQTKDAATVDFIFMMDLLNFSFWSELSEEERFCVEYNNGKRWTGYWSLVAALQRALEEGIPITDPYFWVDPDICSDAKIRHVFRSAGKEEMPLMEERIACLREAGAVLCDRYDGSFVSVIAEAEESAAALVCKVADLFPCFRDEHKFEGKKIHIYKRAQILVADIWACFNATSYGTFHDISTLTMFADYRVPVTLHSLGCLWYSPALEQHIREKKMLPSGSSWEVQVRCASIWAVEMIRKTIERDHPGCGVNAVLIDFYLYDTGKEIEAKGEESLPHHRVRSIWY